MEYDPAVSTHKASSITSTTSTSSSSTWDNPISNASFLYRPQPEHLKMDDQSHTTNNFDEYHHPFDTSLVAERISYDYLHTSSTTECDNEEERQQRKRTFSSYIDTFLTEEENDMLVLNTNIKKENHEKITDSHHLNDQLNNNVTHDNLYPSPSSSLPQPIYLQHGDQITVPSISMINNNRKRSLVAESPNAMMTISNSPIQPRPIRPSPTTASPSMMHRNAVTRQRSSSVCSNNSNSKRSKLNRDLLTDDEKRVNHIASEQKRRNTIRMGFKDLTDIIPTLKNINNSKSTILFKAVEYIKHLDKRNRGLGEKVSSLQVRMKVEGRMAEQQHSRYHRSSSLNTQRYNKVFGNNKQQQHEYHHSSSSNQPLYPSSSSNTTTTSANNEFSHLPAHTVSALLAHKNQQRQLEELQEQLRMQQQLLVKHNIVTGSPPSSSIMTTKPQPKDELPSIHEKRHSFDDNCNRNHPIKTEIHQHRYNSISIPSSRSSNSEDNDAFHHHSTTASFIVPQDLEEQRQQSIMHHTTSVTTRRPWHH